MRLEVEKEAGMMDASRFIIAKNSITDRNDDDDAGLKKKKNPLVDEG